MTFNQLYQASLLTCVGWISTHCAFPSFCLWENTIWFSQKKRIQGTTNIVIKVKLTFHSTCSWLHVPSGSLQSSCCSQVFQLFSPQESAVVWKKTGQLQQIPKMWSALYRINKLHKPLQQFFSSIMSGQSGKPSQIIVCLMHIFFKGHSQRPLSPQPGGR